MKTYIQIWSLATIGLHNWTDCVLREVHAESNKRNSSLIPILLPRYSESMSHMKSKEKLQYLWREHRVMWKTQDTFLWKWDTTSFLWSGLSMIMINITGTIIWTRCHWLSEACFCILSTWCHASMRKKSWRY